MSLQEQLDFKTDYQRQMSAVTQVYNKRSEEASQVLTCLTSRTFENSDGKIQ